MLVGLLEVDSFQPRCLHGATVVQPLGHVKTFQNYWPAARQAAAFLAPWASNITPRFFSKRSPSSQQILQVRQVIISDNWAGQGVHCTPCSRLLAVEKECTTRTGA
jgi:hypothetical protein